jgi:hypothetical protein
MFEYTMYFCAVYIFRIAYRFISLIRTDYTSLVFINKAYSSHENLIFTYVIH